MILSFDKDKLQRIIDSFYLVSGIHSAVFDDKYRGIAWSQNKIRSPLCTALRSIPAFEQKCIECDKAACLRCKHTGKGTRYQCHIGLEEFAVPIITDSNIIVGYIISGQLIPYGKRKETLPLVLERCRPYGLPEETLIKAYGAHREIEAGVVDAAFEILQACTAHAWKTKAATISEASLAFRVSEHIRNNLAADLSIPALCDTLLISRTTLNRLSQESFGMSLQNYVRRMRVEESKRLLEQTSLPINEVASTVGIPDYNYFTKVFRGLAGTTPRDFRKRAESFQMQQDA